jgi:hypothetical protein
MSLNEISTTSEVVEITPEVSPEVSADLCIQIQTVFAGLMVHGFDDLEKVFFSIGNLQKLERRLKDYRSQMEAYLEDKLKVPMQEALNSEDREHGKVTFCKTDDKGRTFEVTTETRKTVTWDQAKLKDIVDNHVSPEKRPNYMKVTYHVDERTYSQRFMPPAERKMFDEARNVKISSPQFLLIKEVYNHDN